MIFCDATLNRRQICDGRKTGRPEFQHPARRLDLSIKAREIAEEKEAVEQFGSSDAGASLGDILGAALKDRD
ncbi:hypothetical protein M3N55_00610 [Roseibaca sp. V10]|uniref:Uncharacterized protein n=1 Tax=Roseinatronobacter domitianus TaxID=2940293 RepID=A0ABT0LX89_9RHOB|nr:hypothetical protein [Roseibaca domitiana]MCL1627221.1 hypothetical protein [Roseibaca domitiana]